MSNSSIERQLNLTQQEIKKNPKLSIRTAAKIFAVPRVTLGRRLNGITSRDDNMPNSRILTSIEEETILEYIIDLDTRSHPPRLADIEEIANRLLTERGAPPIGLR